MEKKDIQEPLMNDGTPKATFEKMDGPDAEDGKVAFMQQNDGGGQEYIGLTKEQLEYYATDTKWRMIRMVLFVLFWLLWIIMFAAAIGIVIAAPKCPDIPIRHWWQRKIGYTIVPHTFKDSNKDGVGDLAGIKDSLKDLKRINVQTIRPTMITTESLNTWARLEHTDTVAEGDTLYSSEYDCMTVDKHLGNMEDFKSLTEAAHKEDMHVVMDLIVPGEKPDDESEWNTHWDKTKKCVQKWLDMGTDGIFFYIHVPKGSRTVKNVDMASMQMKLKEISELVKQHLKEKGLEKEILLASAQHRSDEAGEEEMNKQIVSAIDDEASAGFNFVYNSQLSRVGAGDVGDMHDAIQATQDVFKEFNDTWPAWEMSNLASGRLSGRFGTEAGEARPELAELSTMMLLTLPGAVNSFYGEELSMLDRTIGDDLGSDVEDYTKYCESCGLMQWDKSNKFNGFTSGKTSEVVPNERTDDMVFFKSALSTSFSPVRLFRRLAGLRKDYAFLYGNFKLGSRNTAANKGVISIQRYPGIIKANKFMFAGNFHKNETTVDLYDEFGEKNKDQTGTVLAMTTNMVRRDAYTIRGTVNPGKVTLKPGEGILIKIKES